MNLVMGALKFFSLPFILSLLLVPVAKYIGYRVEAYAMENNRTVHQGKIVRIGGLAIFLAFLISMAVYINADQTINGILVGGIIIFLCGLLDDMFNLSPLMKVIFQSIGALCAIVIGNVTLTTISLPFLKIDLQALSYLVSFIWILGVTNAINLIDGLDGLSSGISLIVVCVIGLLGFFMGRRDVVLISLMLAGAIAGFLPYNFHPASIFVGDSGALFLGFMIACLSLLGFKTSTFITLGFPIIILFVPLSDTVLAIIRRKLNGQKISDADKSHVHHVLMFKIGLGHKRSVLVLYAVTIVFGIGAIVSYFNEFYGVVLLVLFSFIAWIFIELTGMINPRFHPVIGLLRRTIKWPRKSKHAFFEANRIHDDA
ncbi:MAG: MraY family glycosyltransferase [Erysipelotrichaceae bacterium]|nr:MraY family glycosyltransferase [Erysipelotrichaceae bacterium]